MELENTLAGEEKQIELLKKDAALKELKVKKEEDRIQKGRTILQILLGMLILTLITGYLIFKSYRLKTQTNYLLQEKNQEIEKQQKNILDSIQYAHRIQNAFFVPQSEIKEHFPESFVLFKPKDIVSGDFYWLKAKDEKIYFAAADCTGHGVRGALVSIICQDLLNHALNHYPKGDPGTLLAWTSQQLMESLQQRMDPKSGEFGVKDGMDIALCCYDREKQTLSFAGSHAPLYIIRDGRLIVTRGDNNYMGRVMEGEVYQTHINNLEEGDRVYLFSDGYADQKGGPRNKKFYYPPFQQLLIDNHQKPMDEQKEILKNTLTTWQGDNSQVDDILVFGLQLNMD
jgi:serine phosphatase RsbU (regulator of sigma subunit)